MEGGCWRRGRPSPLRIHPESSVTYSPAGQVGKIYNLVFSGFCSCSIKKTIVEQSAIFFTNSL